ETAAGGGESGGFGNRSAGGNGAGSGNEIDGSADAEKPAADRSGLRAAERQDDRLGNAGVSPAAAGRSRAGRRAPAEAGGSFSGTGAGDGAAAGKKRARSK